MSQNHNQNKPLNIEPNNDVSENLIDTWKKSIAGLVESAPNDTIKNCLRIYNPAIPTNDNIKALKSCRKTPIIDTLNYLMSSPSFSSNTIKDDAIHLLCLKIKSFFPDVCQICNKSYSVKLDDRPLISCGGCGQEVHRPCYLNLLKSMNLLNESEELSHLIYKIPGFLYLCPTCQDETINFPHAKIKKSAVIAPEQSSPPASPTQITVVAESAEEQSINCQQTPRRTLPTIPLTPNVFVDSQPNENLEGIYLGRTDFLKKKFQRDCQNHTKLSSENTTNKEIDSTDEKPICNFYKKGKCKHGIRGKNCRFQHPKICTKLLKHGNKSPNGCNAGIKCAMFHPRMCSSSIRKGECFNLDCTFTHVKGTKRDPVNNKFNNTQQTQDFLKILDNFRTEMITMITNNLAIRPAQQPIHTSQQTHPHNLIHRFQDHSISQIHNHQHN